WPLAELDDQALEEASMFLIGRCSCRVKDQNPGWDLLLNVDWDQALKKAGQNVAAAPPESAPPQAPETVVTASKTSEPQVFVINQFVPLPWLAGGGALMLGAAAWLLLRKAPKD
ncbi:MAG TPA: hypothetical protein DIT13_19485, partial [Verrucomicrobiales bacterium]|nr:hypothetical protein [Verrucomicrobiales bacterium]